MSLLGMSTNSSLLKEMAESSEKLEELDATFANFLLRRGKSPASSIELTCFFEEMETVIGLRSIGKVRQSITLSSIFLYRSAY